MKTATITRQELMNENRELRTRLEESEQTLTAIRNGEADAIVCSGPDGERVYRLESADQTYRLLVEAMNEGAATLAPDGSVLYCNERLADMLKRPVEKIVGASIGDFIEGAGRNGLSSFWRNGSSRHRGEMNLKTGDGAGLPVLVSYNALNAGKDVFCMVFTDLSRIKKIEEKLRESNASLEERVALRTGELEQSVWALGKSEMRYRTLFNAMTEGFALHEIICDERGEPVNYRFLDVNPAFERISGLAREDVIGKTRDEIPRLRGEDPKWVKIYGKVALTGEPSIFENYSPALKEHFEIFSFRPERNQFAVIFRNITDRWKRDEDLHKLNRTMKALNNSNHALMHAANEHAFLVEVCRIIADDCGYRMVWIGMAEDDAAKTVRPVASAGFEESYLETLDITWADRERGRGPTGRAIREGRIKMCGDLRDDSSFAPWREEALKRGYASSIVFPLRSGGQRIGALNIYSDKPNAFSKDEVNLLAGLADDLAIGIASIRGRIASERAEAALHESELRYRRLFESAKDGILILDAETGLIVDVNPYLIKMLGFLYEEVTEKKVWELGFFKDIIRNRENFSELRRNKYIRYEDLPLETMDGRKIDVEFVSNVYDVNHRQVIQCNIRDITARKRAEAALRESEKRFQIIIKNSPLIFFLQDDKLRYQWYYGAARRGAEKPVIGKTDRAIYPRAEALYLDDRKRSVLHDGTGSSFEFKRNLETAEFVEHISLEPYREPGGAVIGVYGVGFDVTAQKKAEEILKRDKETFEKLVEKRTVELLSARLELEKAKRLMDIGTLAATVAHELRNPLAAINVAAANIKRKTNTTLLDSHLNTINKKVIESDQIINNLLFFSRIQNPHYEETAIGRVIEECVDMTVHSFKKKITVRKFFTALKDVTIAADPTQLQEVFCNLLNNAHDAVAEEEGEIEISAAADPDFIAVQFKDNGSGIEKQDLDKIFEPFFTTKARGTGLGLAVSRQIICLHGGSISIKSRVGAGTMMTVKLPRKELV